MLKPSTERCMILLQLSFVETVTFTGSIDLLNVIGIVLLTETSVVPSALEIAVTIGAQVSAVAVVDSSSSLVEEQEKARARTDSKSANAMEKLLNFRSTKHPFS